MKKIAKLLFSRIFWVAIAILVEIIWVIIGVLWLRGISPYVNLAMGVITLLMVLWIVNKKINPSYKLAWTILILAIPIFGMVIYFLFGKSRGAKQMEIKFEQVSLSANKRMPESEEVRKKLDEEDIIISNQSKYIRDYAMFPVYSNTSSKYFPSGEMMFENIMEDIKKAEHYIFLEYFIIAKGVMWDTLLDVLEEKAALGVDVRLIYDDMGCITTLPRHFYKELQKKGIKCACFNPFRPVANIILNNRDHRKIIVIDGYIGYTGGVNIADEYINRIERFGYWKDTGVRCQGDAVLSFTTMFLQMWEVITGIHEHIQNFLPGEHSEEIMDQDGFVQPYSDTPLDHETVGENVYLNIINNAKRYVYIFTPYLIIDNEMMTALCLASKRGVDIRIVTPAIPDKKTVFLLTQSYYEELILSGVRVYEYTPGFIHAKCTVCDDEIATVGTINMDYRSLYLHFECGTWLYKTSSVMEVKRDALDTIEHSKPVPLSFCQNRNLVVRALQSIMRLLAPML